MSAVNGRLWQQLRKIAISSAAYSHVYGLWRKQICGTSYRTQDVKITQAPCLSEQGNYWECDLSQNIFKKCLQSTSFWSPGLLCFPVEIYYAIMKACGLTVLGPAHAFQGWPVAGKGAFMFWFAFACMWSIFDRQLHPACWHIPCIHQEKSQCQESFASVFERYVLNTAFIFREPVDAVSQPNDGCPTESDWYSQMNMMQCDILNLGMWRSFRKYVPTLPSQLLGHLWFWTKSAWKRLDTNKSKRVFSIKPTSKVLYPVWALSV